MSDYLKKLKVIDELLVSYCHDCSLYEENVKQEYPQCEGCKINAALMEIGDAR